MTLTVPTTPMPLLRHSIITPMYFSYTSTYFKAFYKRYPQRKFLKTKIQVILKCLSEIYRATWFKKKKKPLPLLDQLDSRKTSRYHSVSLHTPGKCPLFHYHFPQCLWLAASLLAHTVSTFTVIVQWLLTPSQGAHNPPASRQDSHCQQPPQPLGLCCLPWLAAQTTVGATLAVNV